MYLVDFMNKNEDWQDKLAVAPYCIEVKQDGPYWILKYNMIASDFTLPEVREARGAIFTKEENSWICVCRSLDKFANWSEAYSDAKKIDWSQPVSVQEKIDGSIIRCWCHKGLWHVSTNGTIDAFQASCGTSTFGDVFYSIIEKYTTIRNFFELLHPQYTYWFEMVHPLYNHIVVQYKEPAIYYLGCRNIHTMEESELSPTELFYGIRTPKHFNYNSLTDCIATAHNMGVDEEGYVVCAYNQMENGSFLRVKIKGDEYLRLHRLRGNGALTIERVVEMWQTDILDDFIAYYPEYKEFIDVISFSIRKLIALSDIAYNSLKGYPDRKEYALRANTYLPPIRSYLFARLDNKTDCATSWFKLFRKKSLAAFLTEASQIKEMGVEEDI